MAGPPAPTGNTARKPQPVPVEIPKPPSKARLKDIGSIRGVRSNQLTGYGLVIGLDGTGDTKSATFTVQSLANMLQRFGIAVRAADIKVKNVAAVMVTADLGPFVRSGARIDTVVSSMGDAKSLQGGTLIQTPLMGADGKVYAVAQGPISVGGFSFGNRGASVQKNHATVARIPGGATVEADVPMQYAENGTMTVDLYRPDFTTANRVVEAIRERHPELNPTATDAGSIELKLPEGGKAVALVAELEDLRVVTDLPARIVVNERTGVVVIGGNVRIKPVIVAQGGIKVEIRTEQNVSQPAPFSKGKTVVTPTSDVKATEEPAKITALEHDSGTVQQLVRALQQLGVTPQDLIAILQALKDQGALEAELEVQ